MKKSTNVISLRKKRFTKKYGKILENYKNLFFGIGILIVIGILFMAYMIIIK